MRKLVLILGGVLVLFAYSGCATVTQPVNTQDTVVIGGIKPVIQDSMGCAPAVLEMIVQYYGVNLDKRQIAKETGMTMGGTKVKEMLLFLKRQGLTAESLPSSDLIKSYIKQGVPVIAEGKRFGMGQITHAVVVVGYNTKVYYIIDPMRGAMIEMNNSAFQDWNKEYRRWAVKKD